MKKYAYVTLLSSNDYLEGVLLLNHSLKKCNTKYPLYCLTTPNITERVLNIIKKEMNVIQVPYISMSEELLNYNKSINEKVAELWKNCFTKFYVFKMTEFEKIIFLDADLYFTKNVDHVFNYSHMTGAVDGEAFSLWLHCPHLNTGFFVVEPSESLYCELIDFVDNMKDFSWHDNCIADQEVLNYYYKDWPEKQELHLDSVYNVFACYLTNEWANNYQINSLIENSYFFHFVGPKPWSTDWYEKEVPGLKFVYEDVKEIKKKINFKTCIYAICKNEILEVKEWIENTKDADYIAVLDTGSTDGTYELLLSYKNMMPDRIILEQKVFNPWRFDDARNYNMQMIPKDTEICISIDFDERLIENWNNIVQNLWYPECNQINYKYAWSKDKIFWYGKIHSLNDWEWKYPVHEYILYKKDDIKTAATEKILVHHYPKTKNSRQDYLPLLKIRAAEYDDLESWTYLAHEYCYAEQYQECINTINNIIFKRFDKELGTVGKANLLYFVGCSYKGLEDYDSAIKYFDEGICIDYTFRDNFLALGELLIDNKKEYLQGVQVLQNGLLLSKRYCIWLESPRSWGPDIYTYLAIGYYNLKKYDIALSFAETALKMEPNDKLLISNYNCIKNVLES